MDILAIHFDRPVQHSEKGYHDVQHRKHQTEHFKAAQGCKPSALVNDTTPKGETQADERDECR